MFYRRKIILALLDLFEGRLEKLRLQKLLFLFTKKQSKAEYDFIPYKYGCYSYSANADLVTMVQKGLLVDDSNGLTKTDNINYLSLVKEADRKLLIELKKTYGAFTGTSLMKHTYINYPYFAINSVKAPEILSELELDKINLSRPKNNETILYTIGYEGISLEAYINKLIRNDIKVLVDVRRNPLSMKYGFSKTSLKKFCENVDIEYIHLPEVGIESEQRQELNNQDDYDRLFNTYKKNNLTKTISTQIQIINMLKSKKRIALTCFEANICQCHRKHLAESISALPEFVFKIKHI